MKWGGGCECLDWAVLSVKSWGDEYLCVRAGWDNCFAVGEEVHYGVEHNRVWKGVLADVA